MFGEEPSHSETIEVEGGETLPLLITLLNPVLTMSNSTHPLKGVVTPSTYTLLNPVFLPFFGKPSRSVTKGRGGRNSPPTYHAPQPRFRMGKTTHLFCDCEKSFVRGMNSLPTQPSPHITNTSHRGSWVGYRGDFTSSTYPNFYPRRSWRNKLNEFVWVLDDLFLSHEFVMKM